MIRETILKIIGRQNPNVQKDDLESLLKFVVENNIGKDDFSNTDIVFDDILAVGDKYSYKNYLIYNIKNFIVKLFVDNTLGYAVCNAWLSNGVYIMPIGADCVLGRILIKNLMSDGLRFCIYQNLIYSKKSNNFHPMDWQLKKFDCKIKKVKIYV